MDLNPPEIIALAASILLGLCLGSFATALVWRGSRGSSWIVEGAEPVRSACPDCKTKLRAYELVPLFSWLILRGKCRTCRKKIPLFYPLVEIITMLLTVALFWAWDFSLLALPMLLAVPFMLAAIIIDWRHMIIPDDINIALFVLGVIHAGLLYWHSGWDWQIPLQHLAAAVLLFVLFFTVSAVLAKFKGQEALGWGDLKFLPSAGLFLGMSAIPGFITLGGVLGVVTAFLKGKEGKTGAFPFGPALIFSLYIHVFLTGLGFDYKW